MHPWAVVDPVLEHDVELREVADRLMTIVHSGWSDLPEMRPLDPKVWAFLSRHRVATVIPLEACVADQRDEFAERLRNIQALQMRIEATAREVCALLDEAGIETRVLKGLASAFLDYPRPELRHTGDVDLLVPSTRIEATSTALEEAGVANRVIRQLPVLGTGAVLVHQRGVEIDLHDRPFRRSGLDHRLMQSADSTEWLTALGPTERLVHAAGHFITTPPTARRLSGLFDCTVIRDAHAPRPGDVLQLAAEHRVASTVGAALSIEAELSGRAVDADVQWPRLGFLDRRALMTLQRNLLIEQVRRMRDIPSDRRGEYLIKWLWPPERSRRKAFDTMRRRWRRG